MDPRESLKVRAISPPPNLPAASILTPFAPLLIASSINSFRPLRYWRPRRSKTVTTRSAKRGAEVEGDLDSTMSSSAGTFEILANSPLRSSAPLPPRPITKPGLARITTTLTFEPERSISISSKPASISFSAIKRRIRTSSFTYLEYSFSLNQRERHGRKVPVRSDLGFNLCPIFSSFRRFIRSISNHNRQMRRVSQNNSPRSSGLRIYPAPEDRTLIGARFGHEPFLFVKSCPGIGGSGVQDRQYLAAPPGTAELKNRLGLGYVLTADQPS